MASETHEEAYDFIIVGTGLAETAVSCILAKTGKYKILHIDRDSTYGSEFATLNYRQLTEHFGGAEEEACCEASVAGRLEEGSVSLRPADEKTRGAAASGKNHSEIADCGTNAKDKGGKNKVSPGKDPECVHKENLTAVVGANEGAEDAVDEELLLRNREFNIDLTPKLLLQDSKMKDFLLKNEIQDLVSFTAIKGSFFYTTKLHSIPRNEAQSLKSSAVSFMQKPRVVRFFWHVRAFFNGSTAATARKTTKEEFESFGLSQDSVDFIGHAIALNLDDRYLEEEPSRTYDRIVRYVSSIVSFDGSESPYIYPLYGLSELCQAFARRSALFGTLYMLNARIHRIADGEVELTDPDGVRRIARARCIVADPRYFASSRIARQVIRCIMVLKKERRESRNIIFLKRQLGRKNDVFCVVLGAEEMACPEGYEVGILSTVKETEDPEAEIGPVLKKFSIVKRFLEVRNVVENDDTENIIYTRGVDESALMDNIYDDIERILKKLNEF